MDVRDPAQFTLVIVPYAFYLVLFSHLDLHLLLFEKAAFLHAVCIKKVYI